jgi:hypothetical protein
MNVMIKNRRNQVLCYYFVSKKFKILAQSRENVMASKYFIVCNRDTHLRIIGPFDDLDVLNEWVYKGCSDPDGCGPSDNNPSDNPNWNAVELDDVHFIRDSKSATRVYFPIELYAPSDGPMPDSD